MTVAVTVPEIRARKRSRGADPIVMITAYDSPFARVVHAAGVDVILVGDTLAEVVLGKKTPCMWRSPTSPTTSQRWRGPARALVVGDMPWLSYHLEASDTGAQCRDAGPRRGPSRQARRWSSQGGWCGRS